MGLTAPPGHRGVPAMAFTSSVPVPRVKYTGVRGAGHTVVGDRNGVFADAVLDFLARHVPFTSSRSLCYPTRLVARSEPSVEVEGVPYCCGEGWFLIGKEESDLVV